MLPCAGVWGLVHSAKRGIVWHLDENGSLVAREGVTLLGRSGCPILPGHLVALVPGLDVGWCLERIDGPEAGVDALIREFARLRTAVRGASYG